MFYLLQKNTFLEYEYINLTEALERLGLEYELVQVFPFIEDIEFKTERKDVFCFGGLKMTRVFSKYGWKPGCIMTKNHDYEIYAEHYKENLLNYDSKIQRFDDEIVWNDSHYFIRPTLDSKTFTGKVFNKEEWEEFKHYSYTNGHSTSLTKDTLVQVASCKSIEKEYRFWIVDGKIVTGSLYRFGRSIQYDDFVDEGAIEFCKQMIDVFQLAETFILDVCLTEGEWKIVECGCTNAAGFYKADLQKLLIALENFYDPI